MKHKLSLLLAMGALAFGATAAGLVGAKSAQLTKATDADDGHSWGLIGGFSGNSWTSDVATSTAYDAATGTKTLSYLIPEGTAFKIRADAAWTVALNSEVLTNITNGSTYFEDDGTNVKNTKVKTGQTGTYTFTLSGNLYNYSDKKYGVSVSFTAPSTSYVVTEYAVVGGVKEDTALATETAYDGVTFTPTDVHRTDYVFGGWYTDEACTTAYSATKLSAATTLYAKYTIASSTKRVYFGASGWANVYVYTYGTSETCGPFPGTSMHSTAAVTNVNFNQNGLYLYDVPFGTGGDTHIIFSNGLYGSELVQTKNLVLNDNVYYASDSAEDYAGSADLYNAANWVKTIATAVASATNASVCSISKEDATADVALYKGYSTDAQTAINGATLYTWKDINRVDTEKLDVSFASIYAQLDKISTTSTSSAAGVVLDNNTTPVLVMVISLCVAALAAGGLWMSRRKEH